MILLLSMRCPVHKTHFMRIIFQTQNITYYVTQSVDSPDAVYMHEESMACCVCMLSLCMLMLSMRMHSNPFAACAYIYRNPL